ISRQRDHPADRAPDQALLVSAGNMLVHERAHGHDRLRTIGGERGAVLGGGFYSRGGFQGRVAFPVLFLFLLLFFLLLILISILPRVRPPEGEKEREVLGWG